ncbi:MAG: hypothetical protein HKL95_08055, partial [Phycisphaerae bacterium]|nr:hypothetical protein [Phycisphaerae bacterium]
MVTLADTTSPPQSRQRFLRSGLRNFRASNNTRRAAHPLSSNSQFLTSNSSFDADLFRYTGNDPVNNLDPSGHDGKKEPPKPVYHPPQTQQHQQH